MVIAVSGREESSRAARSRYWLRSRVTTSLLINFTTAASGMSCFSISWMRSTRAFASPLATRAAPSWFASSPSCCSSRARMLVFVPPGEEAIAMSTMLLFSL